MVSDREFQQLKREVRSNILCPAPGYKIKRTGAGTTLDIKPGKGGTSEIHPFQAITSVPYLGEGEPPADQGLKFKIRPGIIIGPDSNRKLASNLNGVFTATDDFSDGYYCWAKLSFTATGEEAVTFTAFEYEAGETLPDAEPASEAVPANVYLPLFYVTTLDGAIDSVTQLVKNSQQVSVEVQNITCSEKLRQLSFRAI